MWYEALVAFSIKCSWPGFRTHVHHVLDNVHDHPHRSLFDRIELRGHSSCVVNQALVHCVHHKDEPDTETNLVKGGGFTSFRSQVSNQEIIIFFSFGRVHRKKVKSLLYLSNKGLLLHSDEGKEGGEGGHNQTAPNLAKKIDMSKNNSRDLHKRYHHQEGDDGNLHQIRQTSWHVQEQLQWFIVNIIIIRSEWR